MLKKILIVFALFLLVVVTVFAYYYFWPRYLFRIYGYHNISVENEHSEWSIYLDTSFKGSSSEVNVSKWWNRVYPPDLEKVNIYGSPYQLSIWHDDPAIEIDKIDIMKAQNVVLTLDNGERKVRKYNDGEVGVLNIYRDIELDYQDYELTIHYSLKNQENIKGNIIKVLLRTDLVEEKVSLFEIELGI